MPTRESISGDVPMRVRISTFTALRNKKCSTALSGKSGMCERPRERRRGREGQSVSKSSWVSGALERSRNSSWPLRKQGARVKMSLRSSAVIGKGNIGSPYRLSCSRSAHTGESTKKSRTLSLVRRTHLANAKDFRRTVGESPSVARSSGVVLVEERSR